MEETGGEKNHYAIIQCMKEDYEGPLETSDQNVAVTGTLPYVPIYTFNATTLKVFFQNCKDFSLHTI